MRRFSRYLGWLISSLPSLVFAGCGKNEAASSLPTWTLAFDGVVGSESFSCDKSYAGLGTTGSTVQPKDFRFYIYDLDLIADDGTTERLSLEQDQKWQRDNIALLDFSEDQGACATGDSEVRKIVKGAAPAKTYTGVEFSLGVPESMNHLDAATAPAPLNRPGMWWSWKGGYKFTRIEVLTAKKNTFYFHLGATDCTGTVEAGFKCAANNVPRIKLTGFDPGADQVQFDLKKLYADSDLDAAVNFASGDVVSGCMAFPKDGECKTLFDKFAISYENSTLSPDATQKVFLVKKGGGAQ
jgi:uncharacterized repeat protein (TIGR04052 family)